MAKTVKKAKDAKKTIKLKDLKAKGAADVKGGEYKGKVR
jgi:hypothetical protein